MKIGVDIDDVIVNFNKGFLDFYNAKFNTNFCLEDLHTWRLDKALGISLDKAVLHVEEFFNSENFHQMIFLENAKESLQDLLDFHEIFFITARQKEVKEQTEKFFESHFPEKDYNLLFSGGEVWSEGKSKDEICEELKIPLLIEDRKEYAFNAAQKGIKVLLLDKPWNQGVEHENIMRVNDWKEILEKIRGLENASN